MRTSFIYFFALLFCFSCSSDTDMSNNDPTDPNDPMTEEVKLIERYVDGELRGEWSYDDQDRLSSAITYNNGVVFQEFTFDYLNDEEYDVTVSGSFPRVEKHRRISDTEVRLEEYTEADELVEYFVYLYDTDQNCGFTEFRQFDADDNIRSSSVWNYMGFDCNYETLYYDEYGELSGKENAILDGKNNAFSSVRSLALQNAGLANVLELTAVDATGNPDTGSSYTSVFTYNDEDYPLTEERTFGTGNIRTFTYVYE